MTCLQIIPNFEMGCVRYRIGFRSASLPSRGIHAHPTKYPPSSRRSNLNRVLVLRGSVDQAEDVVENEIAAGTVGLELEALSVVHGLLLLVDLYALKVLGVTMAW